jgi:hypothetical protein
MPAAGESPGAQLISGVDRLDYSKGLPRNLNKSNKIRGLCLAQTSRVYHSRVPTYGNGKGTEAYMTDCNHVAKVWMVFSHG